MRYCEVLKFYMNHYVYSIAGIVGYFVKYMGEFFVNYFGNVPAVVNGVEIAELEWYLLNSVPDTNLDSRRIYRV